MSSAERILKESTSRQEDFKSKFKYPKPVNSSSNATHLVSSTFSPFSEYFLFDTPVPVSYNSTQIEKSAFDSALDRLQNSTSSISSIEESSSEISLGSSLDLISESEDGSSEYEMGFSYSKMGDLDSTSSNSSFSSYEKSFSGNSVVEGDMNSLMMDDPIVAEHSSQEEEETGIVIDDSVYGETLKIIASEEDALDEALEDVYVMNMRTTRKEAAEARDEFSVHGLKDVYAAMHNVHWNQVAQWIRLDYITTYNNTAEGEKEDKNGNQKKDNKQPIRIVFRQASL